MTPLFVTIVVMLVGCIGVVRAEDAQWRYDFEESSLSASWQADTRSTLDLSGAHFKSGAQALRWEGSSGSRILFTDPDPGRQDELTGFRAWVYNEQAQDAELTFSFGTESELTDRNPRYVFQFGLQFTGWRAMWIDLPDDATNPSYSGARNGSVTAFDIVASSSSTVYLDLMEFVEKIHWARSADAQVPFVNAGRDGGRDPYYRWSLNSLPGPVPDIITDGEQEAFQAIAERYESWVLGEHLDTSQEPVRIRLESLSSYIDRGYRNLETFEIRREGDRILGKPLFASRSPYEPLFLDVFQDVLMRLVLDYRVNGNITARDQIMDVFDYLNDQGWATGSGNGTLDHEFLRVAGYAHAVYLMRDDLRASGRLEREMATLEWHCMFGELYEPSWDPGTNADYMRTVSIFRLLRILMMEDSGVKVATMRRYVDWLNSALAIAPGWLDTIKPDFLGFHHRGVYANAYAPNGFHVASLVAYLLSDTPFAIDEDKRDNLKNALLVERVIANTYDIPTAINGRFPFQTEVINEILPAYMYLALAFDPVDPDLAKAFMRLWQPETSYLKEGLFPQVSARIMYLDTPGAVEMMVDFANRGFEAEPMLSGHWTLPYGGLSVHRREDWMVAMKGWSKYVWDFESSSNENLLGRYLSYGSTLIYGTGDPTGRESSGIARDGWDWTGWPGTTVIRLSDAELAESASDRNLSDQTFVGGVSLEGQNGVFALKMHDTVHDTSFRATKTVFCFDNVLVCLGSGISNGDGAHSTVTTLFQASIAGGQPTVLNGEVVQTIPYSGGEGVSWLMDSVGNGYVLPDGDDLQVVRRTQSTGDYGKEGGGTGTFEQAWIDHGPAPAGTAYEYAVLVKTTADAVGSFASSPTYSVLQQDSTAHIVRFPDLASTGYALFEVEAKPTEGVVAEVDLPSILMAREVDDGVILSVSDPDYGWNRQIQVPHQHSTLIPNQPSKPRSLRVTLRGTWALDRAYTHARIADIQSDRTIVAFTCQDGKTIEVKLVASDEAGGDTGRLDFDSDGVIGFGDFLQFAGSFGLSESDTGFEARFDLNGDGGIGFPDFLTFAEGFGKVVGDLSLLAPSVRVRAG
jgi:chondroitin-sulfate-ABC endolyase/exolyase